MQAFKQIIKDDEHLIENAKINKDLTHQNHDIQPHKQFEEFKKIYLTAYILSVEKNRLKENIEESVKKIEKI